MTVGIIELNKLDVYFVFCWEIAFFFRKGKKTLYPYAFNVIVEKSLIFGLNFFLTHNRQKYLEKFSSRELWRIFRIELRDLKRWEMPELLNFRFPEVPEVDIF